MRVFMWAEGLQSGPKGKKKPKTQLHDALKQWSNYKQGGELIVQATWKYEKSLCS